MARGNILLLVSGGIAAYKACYLTRLLRQAGFAVKVAMTEAAQHFVTPMTFRVLSENPVATDLWGEGQSDALDHVEYARWADLAVIAPATANILAKLAHGIGDDIVSTLLLAHPGPVVAAPAMNDNMWAHPATRQNLDTLRRRGVHLVEPGEGWLACGVHSKGRLAEPEDILAEIERVLDVADAARPFWRGKRVVVTAGPTREAVDAIRFLSNRSTGTMGMALAGRLAQLGAEVTLVRGPGTAAVPEGLVRVHEVTSAADMAVAVAAALDAGCDWLFMAAAVADYAPREVQPGKVKKDAQGDVWRLELVRTPDILRDVVAPRRRGLRTVGFALETDDLLARAGAKRAAKGLDWIVANDPTAAGGAFGDQPHSVHLIGPAGPVWTNAEPGSKADLALGLLRQLALAEGTSA
ncbi:MAG: bifunctional phosphopantothenoylcysteine decarboxylase/phosphopantothenate--cysteine ligase CoaBC [Candidatus Krumholzibacteriia bacterium]